MTTDRERGEFLQRKMERASRISYEAFRRVESVHEEAMRLAAERDEALNEYVQWKLAHRKEILNDH